MNKLNNHTRNQKRMYRIHKLEERIKEQDLLIGSLKEKLRQKENVIKEIKIYLKENEKEYGSLEDNEKIILRILSRIEKR